MQVKPLGQSPAVVQSRAQKVSPSGALKQRSVGIPQSAMVLHLSHCCPRSGMQIESPLTMEQYVPLGQSGGHTTVQYFLLPTVVQLPVLQSASTPHGLPVSPV